MHLPTTLARAVAPLLPLPRCHVAPTQPPPSPSVPRGSYVLHRLDHGTSGMLLFAKTIAAARSITRQFATRQTQKAYLAILLGQPDDDSFE